MEHYLSQLTFNTMYPLSKIYVAHHTELKAETVMEHYLSQFTFNTMYPLSKLYENISNLVYSLFRQAPPNWLPGRHVSFVSRSVASRLHQSLVTQNGSRAHSSGQVHDIRGFKILSTRGMLKLCHIYKSFIRGTRSVRALSFTFVEPYNYVSL